jgi:hypothetical protein
MPVNEIELFPFDDIKSFDKLKFSDAILSSITKVVVDFEFQEYDSKLMKKLGKLAEFKNCEEVYYKNVQSVTAEALVDFVLEAKALSPNFSLS